MAYEVKYRLNLGAGEGVRGMVNVVNDRMGNFKLAVFVISMK